MLYCKFYFFAGMISFLVFNSLGCVPIMEGAKGIAGVSTKVLEDGRAQAIVKNFNYNYPDCRVKVLESLKHIGAYIYAQDSRKKMIAIYISESDTTPVGIFFQEADATHTQLQVSSPSTFARESISAKVFASLEKDELAVAPGVK